MVINEQTVENKSQTSICPIFDCHKLHETKRAKPFSIILFSKVSVTMESIHYLAESDCAYPKS